MDSVIRAALTPVVRARKSIAGKMVRGRLYSVYHYSAEGRFVAIAGETGTRIVRGAEVIPVNAAARALFPPRPRPAPDAVRVKRRILRELRDLHATWLDHPPAGFATEDAFRVAQGIAKAIDLVQAVRP